ncbi:O-antigen ligase family protein [Parablautia intestinalis]|nr:O-antigen ligase family protein [Parablautia intestinalis]
MKKIVYKSRAIQAVILIVAACLLVSLWPLRIWHETVSTEVIPQGEIFSEVVDEEKTILQEIVAQYNHMDTIDVYLDENSHGETFFLRILDEQWQMVCEEETAILPENLPGFQEVVIDVDMEVGKTYFVILQGDESEIFSGWGPVPAENTPYMGMLYYADSSQEGMSLMARYNYSMPLRKTWVFGLGVLIVGITAFAILGVRLWYKKKEDKLTTVEKVFKRVMNPIVAAGVLICIGAVLAGYCGNYLLDNTVYFVSVVLLALILFYSINHDRVGQPPIFTRDYLKSHLGDLIQSVAIAGAVAGCCEYMSGLYDIHHTVAERKEMLWFSLAVLAMFKWKEIVNAYNLIYLGAAGLCGYHYYQMNLTEEMDELAVQALKYTVWIAILLGLIVIRTLIRLCKRKLTRVSYVYAALITVFFALIIIFRNGRWWSVALAVAFGLFYLNYGMWEHKERIFVNIARGIIIQFMWSTGYALLHRPYVTFRNARYTHIFHTVTITASYLTIVECATAVILLSKLRKSRKLKDCYKELVLFGVVSSYMLFTMSRTAFLAVGITVLFAIGMMAGGRKLKFLKNYGKNLGMLLLSVAVCLPVTFTVQRNIPALVSDPFLYEIEYSMYCPEDVMRGRRLWSKNFMRVGRFIDVFAEKIFSIPEGTFDIYGEIEEYERTHKDRIKAEIPDEAEDESRALEIADNVELVASTDYVPEGVPKEALKDEDYTNGRLDIFKSYLEQLNMTGHEEMGAVLKNGEIATHAHNIYLQVAYDHGIPVGIFFILLGIGTFIRSCLYYRREKDKITYASFPAVVSVAVAVAGMVEWIFHLSNPCGLVLMLAVTPLIFRES